uniref:SLED domain-containing protein n=1 Tax=Trichuris muris TaxID=70415 RepID=A0A5S6Q9P2_TRIMR
MKPCRPLIIPTTYDPWMTYCWSDKIGKSGFTAAPVSAFKHSPWAPGPDSLSRNVKVEVPNMDYIIERAPFLASSCYWIATMVRVEGYKVLLRYEGFGDSSHDFWINIYTADVHPVAWCAKTGNILQPPKALHPLAYDWKRRLRKLIEGSHSFPDNFQEIVREHCKPVDVAVRLETIDYRCSANAVVPVTVRSSVASRVNVIEWEGSGSSFVESTSQRCFQMNCNIKSPFLFPVGWAVYFEYPIRCSESYLEAVAQKCGPDFYFTEDDEKLLSPQIELVRRSQSDNKDGYLSCFLSGMKIEAIDPLLPTAVQVGTIVKTLRDDYYIVRFDGTDKERCYHVDSAFVLPPGFCQAAGIDLCPPPGFENNFTWHDYLTATDSLAASHTIFRLEPYDREFKVGQSLEATDVVRGGQVYPGTIVQMCGRLLKIHFDGYPEDATHWFDFESPDIYPVGWCEMVGVQLCAPGDWPYDKSASLQWQNAM